MWLYKSCNKASRSLALNLGYTNTCESWGEICQVPMSSLHSRQTTSDCLWAGPKSQYCLPPKAFHWQAVWEPPLWIFSETSPLPYVLRLLHFRCQLSHRLGGFSMLCVSGILRTYTWCRTPDSGSPLTELNRAHNPSDGSPSLSGIIHTRGTVVQVHLSSGPAFYVTQEGHSLILSHFFLSSMTQLIYTYVLHSHNVVGKDNVTKSNKGALICKPTIKR